LLRRAKTLVKNLAKNLTKICLVEQFLNSIDFYMEKVFDIKRGGT